VMLVLESVRCSATEEAVADQIGKRAVTQGVADAFWQLVSAVLVSDGPGARRLKEILAGPLGCLEPLGLASGARDEALAIAAVSLCR